MWANPSFLRIWSHLPKKSLMENFIFCAITKKKKKQYILEFGGRYDIISSAFFIPTGVPPDPTTSLFSRRKFRLFCEDLFCNLSITTSSMPTIRPNPLLLSRFTSCVLKFPSLAKNKPVIFFTVSLNSTKMYVLVILQYGKGILTSSKCSEK